MKTYSTDKFRRNARGSLTKEPYSKHKYRPPKKTYGNNNFKETQVVINDLDNNTREQKNISGSNNFAFKEIKVMHGNNTIEQTNISGGKNNAFTETKVARRNIFKQTKNNNCAFTEIKIVKNTPTPIKIKKEKTANLIAKNTYNASKLYQENYKVKNDEQNITNEESAERIQRNIAKVRKDDKTLNNKSNEQKNKLNNDENNKHERFNTPFFCNQNESETNLNDFSFSNYLLK